MPNEKFRILMIPSDLSLPPFPGFSSSQHSLTFRTFIVAFCWLFTKQICSFSFPMISMFSWFSMLPCFKVLHCCPSFHILLLLMVLNPVHPGFCPCQCFITSIVSGFLGPLTLSAPGATSGLTTDPKKTGIHVKSFPVKYRFSSSTDRCQCIQHSLASGLPSFLLFPVFCCFHHF